MKRLNASLPALLLALAFSTSFSAHAADGKTWMSQVDQRPESPWQTATMQLTVTPKGGAPQVRESAVYSRLAPTRRESAVYFRAPAAMKKTAFLSVSSSDGSADEQWLYLPALQTVRRVPASSRGGSFVGTDLSYEDVQRVGKLSLADWQFGDAQVQPDGTVQVIGTATPAAAKELGYTHAQWRIDPKSRFIVEVTYSDAQRTPVKRMWVGDLREVGGYWTAGSVRVQNARTGSETAIRFSDIAFGTEFDAAILSSKGLQTGKGLK
jgi:hypothetical protein